LFYLRIVFYILSDVLVLFSTLHRAFVYQKMYCGSGEIYSGAESYHSGSGSGSGTSFCIGP
jgi:hypothetical protein